MNRKLPLFFFHIPKTAGSSMQGILSSYYKAGEVAEAFTWTTLLAVDPVKRSRAELFQGHFYGPLEQVVGRKCNTFTLLRDPIERALSHYGHVVRDESHYLHRQALALGSLDAYLENEETQLTISNFQARMLALDFDVPGFYSQMAVDDRQHWGLERHLETTDFGLSEEQIFSAAQKKLQSFFLVGLTERFASTLAWLCHQLGWRYPSNVDALNINSTRLKQTDLPTHTLARLRQLNAVDIALYSSTAKNFDLNFNNWLIQCVNANSRVRPLSRLWT